MTPFIRNDQYNYIKQQAEHIVNGFATSNDKHVRRALKSVSLEKVLERFDQLSMENEQLLTQLMEVENPLQKERYLTELKPYVISFSELSETGIKKFFPKAKKLKIPVLSEIDWHSLTYLAWQDKGANKYFLIMPIEEKLVGLQGTMGSNSQKGICTICNRHSEVALFLSETKGAIMGTYTKRGNYICIDSKKCNEQITTLENIHEFIHLVTKK